VKRSRLFIVFYPSARWVGEKLVIRSRRSPPRRRPINDKFRNVLRRGAIVQKQGVTPQERNDPEILSLPPARSSPHRRSFGRFRQFIDSLNRAECVLIVGGTRAVSSLHFGHDRACPSIPRVKSDVIARQWRSVSHGGLPLCTRYYFIVDLACDASCYRNRMFACELKPFAAHVSGELSILQQFQIGRHLFLRPVEYNQGTCLRL